MRTVALIGALLSTSCTPVTFLVQAALGQLQLNQLARPIPEVLRDPTTASRERALLAEVLRAKAFGTGRGLDMHSNYEEYVALSRPYVVWFVNASASLKLKPVSFSFPIAGTFPGLSWFDEADANAFAAELRERNLDVHIRGVTAFSTGGWFRDPVVSSMFVDSAAQQGIVVNTILHESVHATVLVPHQQYFNESLASFVADRLTPQYLKQYYGETAREVYEYLHAVEARKKRTQAVRFAIEQLEAVYDSSESDEAKANYKHIWLAWLQAELGLDEPPNNATLVGFQLYQEAGPEFDELLSRCGHDWRRFLAAFQGLSSAHFGERQSADVGRVVQRISRRDCRPLPVVVAERSLSPQLRRHLKD